LNEALHRFAYGTTADLKLARQLDLGQLRLGRKRAVENSGSDAVGDQLRSRAQA
jgi:hypothetical protein